MFMMSLLVFCVVMPCGTCKSTYVTTYKTNIDIFTAVRTSVLINLCLEISWKAAMPESENEMGE
jgi:hypothetical protein